MSFQNSLQFSFLLQVASRRVFQVAGIIMIICGVIGKFGAILTLIPEPIIGGSLTVLFGMVAAVGISTLKFIDMNSTRNLTILGLSLLIGLMVPQYINHPDNVDAIKTGQYKMSCIVRKLAFCICEKKDVDQLRGNLEADQRLCFRYIGSTIPLLPIYEISSL